MAEEASETVRPRKDGSRQEALKSWMRALEAVKDMNENPEATLLARLTSQALSDGGALALIGAHEQLTYGELVARAGRYRSWATARGLGAGDVVCLLMQNCPDYVAIWLGLAGAGCIVALLNTNLRGDALLHCIAASGARELIAAPRFEPDLAPVAARLAAGLRYHLHGAAPHDLLAAEEGQVWHAGEVAAAPPKLSDPALFIYTSGTTGLPKAAKVSHGRIVEWSLWFAGLTNASSSDRLYNCLPMYHSVGGVVAVGSMLASGGAVVIRERFSASRFWDDVIAERCTIFQYIGELCRYLVKSQPHPRERQHGLRLCCGNGLSGEVWEVFQQRFAVPRILEFYAATEGSVSLYNCEGKPGAIGRVPPFLAHRFPVAIVKTDLDTGEPHRDARGFCTPCAPDEAGEAIGKVLDTPALPAREFQGYTDAASTGRKLLRHVFTEDDLWFRSGDLMRKDSAGYFYFVDRLGDTFRWKGENVAAAEVANVFNACPGVEDAVVFGVAIPGHDGRAGMAAVSGVGEPELREICSTLAASLPLYARPVFLRLCGAIERTGTFKLRKEHLAKQGYAAAADPVWFIDWRTMTLVPCDDVFRQHVAAGGLSWL